MEFDVQRWADFSAHVGAPMALIQMVFAPNAAGDRQHHERRRARRIAAGVRTGASKAAARGY